MVTATARWSHGRQDPVIDVWDVEAPVPVHARMFLADVDSFSHPAWEEVLLAVNDPCRTPVDLVLGVE